MPTLAGWLTGEQVPQEVIEQTLMAMGEVLGRHGGERAFTTQPGAGLIAFSDTAFAMRRNDDPPVLDWVPDRRTMVYRRPLSGAHTLYYIEDWPAQGNLLFASEIKALFALGVSRQLHLPALDALLRYGFIPAPLTAFKGIHVVPAGSIIRWQQARIVVNQSTDFHLESPLSSSDTQEQLQALLETATEGLLPPHDQLVALTGGDTASALATILAARHTQSAFRVASFGYMKGKSETLWRATERLAEECQRPYLAITGVDQPEFWTATISALEAPAVDTRPLALHQLLHTAAVETAARVAISGLGGETLLGPASSKSSLKGDMLNWYSNTLTSRLDATKTRLWSQEAAQLIQQEESWEASLQARKLARRAGQFADSLQGWYYLDLHLRLPDYIVHTAQQLAIPERMVIRSPYLNTDVINFLSRLPAVSKNGATKVSLLGHLQQQYSSKRAKASAALSLNIPTETLLDVDNSELLQQTLSPEAIQAKGIFNPQVVEELLQQKEVSRELLLVFTTQLLCQLFDTGM